VATRDAAGGTTQYQYGSSGCSSCSGGGDKLTKLIDPNGNATTWEHDLQGRLNREVRADGNDAVVTYENTTSRVKQIRDRKQQLIDFQYFLDNRWKQVSYSNTTQPTPTVSLTYDPVYGRLATMTDGTGTTSYTYYPVTSPPTLGAGRLQAADGPLGSDVITYSYDELGRVVGRSINGTGLSLTYDALGRPSGETSVLGAFSYGYDGVTDRVNTVAYPNGQSSTYSYFGNSSDHRLQQILHQRPGGATLSSFQYTYDANGMIASWTQQTDNNPAKAYGLERDALDRVVAATWQTTDLTPTVLKRYRYAHDGAGNRTTEQVDDAAVAATHDSLNMLTGLQPGGALSFRGAVNEPASVSVQGKPATVDATNAFQAQAQVGSGTTNVEVAATDASGNTRTNTYQVSVSGSATTLTYDANGNLSSGGERTFEWDGANRLTAVNQGTHRSEFTYDGWGHRVRIVEKDNAVITTDRRFLWCGSILCEERDATGATVARRFFAQGVEESGTPLFYATDHLGSIRELTDATGALRGRYEYEPYGRATKVSGDKDSVFTFGGLVNHVPSSLLLANYRAYDPGLGRWISPDPIGLEGGINLYTYVHGTPFDASDPLGLLVPAGAVAAGKVVGGAAAGGGAAAAIGVGVGAVIVVGLTWAASKDMERAWDWAWNGPDDPQDQTQTQPQPQPPTPTTPPGPTPPPPSKRKQRDPVRYKPFNPGCDSSGKCRPCPPDEAWEDPGNAHGSTTGTHWTWIKWNQDPKSCMCHPSRGSGPTKPAWAD
jgi:RHS repeat-associated protein